MHSKQGDANCDIACATEALRRAILVSPDGGTHCRAYELADDLLGVLNHYAGIGVYVSPECRAFAERARHEFAPAWECDWCARLVPAHTECPTCAAKAAAYEASLTARLPDADHPMSGWADEPREPRNLWREWCDAGCNGTHPTWGATYG